jgi:hypothetical protein
LNKRFVPVIVLLVNNHTTVFIKMFRTQSTPDFSVAEHYGLRNTTCLYSKDVASEIARK